MTQALVFVTVLVIFSVVNTVWLGSMGSVYRPPCGVAAIHWEALLLWLKGVRVTLRRRSRSPRPA